MKPPKKIRIHNCHNQVLFLTKKEEKKYCGDCDAVPAEESTMFDYILLSEHEKLLAKESYRTQDAITKRFWKEKQYYEKKIREKDEEIKVHLKGIWEVCNWKKRCEYDFDYILLSEHEHQLSIAFQAKNLIIEELNEQLAEKDEKKDEETEKKLTHCIKICNEDKEEKNKIIEDLHKEIENLKGADRINKTMAKETLVEIKNIKQRYENQLLERNKIIEGLANRLPMPPNVTISRGVAKKWLKSKEVVR